ncbi:LCP family protein [bacterium]|nr:LCP family protein [bacterium]
MEFFGKRNKGSALEADFSYNYNPKDGSKKSGKIQGWKKTLLFLASLLILAGGISAWKTGHILNKVSTRGNIFSNLTHIIPGMKNEIRGESEGRINILLLGMRGENVPGGGLLADTIMVASVKPAENKVALVSIPRDLYVTVPETDSRQKINAVYYYGEQKKKEQGLEDMKTIVSEIAGMPIHYSASINFKGFTELIDHLGGVELHLDKPFIEPLQFHEEHVCDENVYTVPSGNFEEKKNKKGKVVAKYPLCYNKDLECGGIFELPAGDITLDGEKALCYVRSRVTSSDFDRARRQQKVLQKIKEKSLSLGVLANFGKINAMLNSLGDNVRTDMQLWEMKRMFEIYQAMGEVKIYQKVLENSEEGLLYSPEITSPEQGYILLPRGDNYDRIKEMFENIFNE